MQDLQGNYDDENEIRETDKDENAVERPARSDDDAMVAAYSMRLGIQLWYFSHDPSTSAPKYSKVGWTRLSGSVNIVFKSTSLPFL